MKVFIVVHHEIMGPLHDLRVDEVQFYTASSLKKALKLIRESHVDRWSWWEIQMQELDGHEWPERVAYYGRRGGKLAQPPVEKCKKLYKRSGRPDMGTR